MTFGAGALGEAGGAQSPRGRRCGRWMLLAPLVPLLILDIVFVIITMLSER